MEQEKINILCVEDGSVDIDEISEDGLQDGMILPYRQGSTPPFVLSINKPTCIFDLEAKYAAAVKELKEVKAGVNTLVEVELRTLLDKIGSISDGYTASGEFIYRRNVENIIREMLHNYLESVEETK